LPKALLGALTANCRFLVVVTFLERLAIFVAAVICKDVPRAPQKPPQDPVFS